MSVVFYWMAISHPSQAAKKMLDLKHVPYKRVDVLPLSQRVHLRLAGFRGGTVPALKLDGRRLQGSRAISRALDQRWPDPPLFPEDPELRSRVEEAERWGDQELQPLPRRLFRYAVATYPNVRRETVRSQCLPAPGLIAIIMLPAVIYYGRTMESDGRRAEENDVRADLDDLPAKLDRVDRLLQDGTLTLEPPNAAALQILATVRVLDFFEDLAPVVRTRACAEPARRLFPDYHHRIPAFLPSEWLAPHASQASPN